MHTNITTERLHLDALTVEDHDFIHELVNSEGWLRFIGDRNIHSKEDAITYINKINSTPSIQYWVVRLLDTKAPVGIISFIKRNYLEHYDIGFSMLPRYSGKGYAYEAAKAVLSMLSAMPEYSTVLATVLPDNVSSIKLLTKLGLHFERIMEVEGEQLHVYTNGSKSV